MAKGRKKAAKELSPEERLQNALVPKEEWPYELPEGWKWVRLGGIADVVTGNTPSKKRKAFYGGNIPFYKPADLDQQLVYSATEYLSIKGCEQARVIPELSTMICCIGSIGKTGIAMREGATNQQINTLIPVNVNPWYLFYYANSDYVKNQLIQKASATTISIVKKTKTEQCIVPLAPEKTQIKIVDLIDKEFHRLDEAKDKMQSVLDSSEKRKQSILHKAFAGELTVKWRKEKGISLDSWHKEMLKSVCDINPKKEDVSGYDDNLEVSFFPMASLDDRVGAITEPQIRPLKEVKKGFTNFKEGDVVFAKITPCMENGKSAVIGKLVNDIGYGTTEFYVFRCGDKINRYYLFHLLRSKKFRDDAKQEMTGAVGQQRVPKKYLEDYEVNLPSVDEQKEIVRILDKYNDKVKAADKAAAAVIEKTDEMKKSILAKAFRGELNI